MTPLVANGLAPSQAIRRVLVATDFSLDGDRALRRVSTLALAPGAVVTIAHVLPERFKPTTESIIHAAAEQRLDAAREKLEGLMSDRGRSSVTVRSELRRGPTAQVIGDLARSTEAELVVVGRGRPGIRGLVLGSTALQVVRQARWPVLVVRTVPEGSYARAVVAYDQSGDALRAMRLAAKMISRSDARVTVVHAFEDPYRGIPPALITLKAREPATERAGLIRERALRVRRAMKPYQDRGQWSLRIKQGDPRKVVLETAALKSAQLIAMGSAGRTGALRVLLGSVAEAVLHGASADTLIVPGRRPR